MCHNSPILAFLQSYLPQKKANDKSNLIVDSESYSVLEQLKCTKWFPFDSARVKFAVNHNCGCLIQASASIPSWSDLATRAALENGCEEVTRFGKEWDNGGE